MPQLSFTPVGHQLLVAILAALLLGLLALGPLGSGATRGRKVVLLGLRLIVFVLVILAMLRPTLVYTDVKKQQATLVLLVDRSRSMLVADAFGDKTRWQALESTLREATPALADLAEDLEIKVYAFDAEAHEVAFQDEQLDLGGPPDGQQTAIGHVLEDVLRREAGKRLAGVILLSDGAVRAYAPRDVPPQAPAGRMRDLGYKLYTLAFGQAKGAGQSKDLALRDLTANQTVFIKNQLLAGGVLRSQGFVDQSSPVQLLFETSPGKMEVVGSKQVSATQDGQELPIELSYVPQSAGEFKVTLRAVPQPGELMTTNNEVSTFVTVLDGGLNVLYLDGRLLPEQKFLLKSLDASPDIRVVFQGIDAQKPQAKPADLIEHFKPGKYNVYLIGDVDSAAFTEPELAALRTAVDKGAGLMMLGGSYSFGPGGYAATPLADVLPIEMDKLERQRFGDALRGDVHLPGPLKMRPAAAAAGDYLVQLGGDNNRAAWDKLPPLEGANKFGKLKPAAHKLIESEAGQALLVAQESGNGRVLAFAGDSTWRWVMQGHGELHKRFWRQVVLWLARKDEITSGNVWVKLDQRRFSPGGRVEFSAGARTAQGDAVTDADFKAEIVLPDDTRRPLTLGRMASEPAWSAAFFETQAAGDYTVVVTASKDGVSLGTAKARFLVFEQDLELDNAVAETGVLQSLAATTGGEALAPEQLPALLEKLKQLPQELEIEIQTKKTLWDTWPFFLALTTVLALEWFLRKRWGLV